MPSQVILRELVNRAVRDHGQHRDPDVTCFLIHHSGGSASSFMPLVPYLPETWRTLAVELPGRGSSVGQSACRDTSDLVSLLAPAVIEKASGRYVVFGHSLGALVAYELAREVERRGAPPVWLGVSGSHAPQRTREYLLERRDLWSRERLVGFLRKLGGTPEEMLEIPDIVDYMVNVLRSDLRIVDTYEHTDGPPLNIPISIFSGESDPLAPLDSVDPWRERSLASVNFHTFPGGHFYLFDHPEIFCKSLVAVVDSVLSAAPTTEYQKGRH